MGGKQRTAQVGSGTKEEDIHVLSMFDSFKAHKNQKNHPLILQQVTYKHHKLSFLVFHDFYFPSSLASLFVYIYIFIPLT